jgi:hypothetical protein
MTKESRRELSGCLSLLLCGLALCICGVWIVFGAAWPQALVGSLLAIAILLKD